MTNILILMERQEAVSCRYRELLQARFDGLHVDIVGHHTEVEPYIAKTDVLMCFSPPMADHVVRDAPNLKWIQALGTGLDNIIDLPSLRKNVIVSNIRGIHGAPMSEAAFAYMLSAARDMPRSVRAQDQHSWQRWPVELLDGKTVGILGVGLIAEALAPKCKIFGMNVIGLSSSPRPTPSFDRMVHRDDLMKVAGELDFLIALTPLTAETRNIIGAKVLAAMRASSYVINLARGGIVDENALIGALNKQQIKGAVLDVFEKEPLPPEHPFWGMKNVTIMCHLGGFSEGYEKRAMPTIENNMRCFLAGDFKNMTNVVRAAS